MAVKYLDNAGTQYLVNKIKAIDGKIPTESQITTMITTALNTYKEGIVTIVESLPQTGEEGKLYLMVDPSDSDVYIIYTWEENAFKRMGSKTFTLTVDSALSSTSTNPVQNKVIKTALDGKANSSHTHGSITNDGKLGTASRVVITGTDKKIGISTVTTTELGYLSGVTSAIQTQLNSKSATGHTHTAGDVAGLATVATTGSYNDLSSKPSIPTKTSDLTNDSNFVDTSNSAVASGITSAKVTSYDSHVADTDIHVTTADKNRWNNQTYVFRYSSTALVASSTNSNTLLDNTDNLKVGDKVIDSDGVLFSVTAIDTANSTFTIGTALVDLAQDSDVVHKTGDETSTGFKQFANIRATNSIKGINLDSTTTDLNNCYSDFAPYSENKGGNIQYYYCNTEAGTANISNLPESKAFFLTSITTRLISNSLYVKQILINSNNKTFTRYCNNSTWSSWVNETDSEYVHKSGDESITGTKTFGNGTLIVNNSIGNNVHGEIKLYGSRPGYIVADNASDGVFDNNNCGVSILLQDIGKPLHIGGYKVDSNGRVFVDNTNKNPVLSITSSLVKTSSLVPENDTGNSAFRILSQLDYANGNPPKVLDVRFIQYDNANATSAIYSNDDGKTSLGATAKRWSGVYSTSYYYGNDNVEFSTKFVTTDTNQTISGEKTFNDLHIIGYGTQYKGARNAYILPEFSAGYSGLAITTLGFPQTVKIGNFVLDANNKPSLDTSKGYIQIATGESNGVNSCVLESRNSTYSSLGTSVNRWSKIYGTEYYYGSNNVEFSTKFVTTDTNQTISGGKTFSSPTRIYNSNATVQADVPSLVFKNSLVERASTTLDGEQTILFTDKNDNNIASIQAKTYTSGISDIILTSYSEYDGVKTTGIMIRRTPTTSKLQGYSDNITDLGDTNRRWRRVYATSYYYGSDNIEFSTKFVTTDTAQTISGVKTFEGVDLKLKSVAGEYTVSSGSTSLLFYDKNSLLLSQYKQGVFGSGISYQNFSILGYDSNNQQLIKSITFSSSNLNLSTAYLRPDTDNAISLGRSNNRWSDVQTYKVNALEPSSLSLPSGNASDSIDISSYLSVLDGSNANTYVAPANGWISIAMSNCMAIQAFIQNGLWGHQVIRPTAGGIRFLMPILKNLTANISIVGGTIFYARFIPCQGNV